MLKSKLRFVAFVAIVGLVAAFAASAQAPKAESVPITPELSKYFQDMGVDPQFLGMAKDKVPAAQWNKILDVVHMDNQTDPFSPPNTIFPPAVQYPAAAAPDLVTYHDNLNDLVTQALTDAARTAGDFKVLKLSLGDETWYVETGDSADTSYVAF